MPCFRDAVLKPPQLQAISAMPSKKVAIYARVSSTSQRDGAGIDRQTSRCKAVCKSIGDKLSCEVAEVISGSLPLQKRKVFNELMTKCKAHGISKILVEGSRAFARNADIAQTIYEKSKALGVTIIPVDCPDLCVHDPNPCQNFIRRVMFAYTELEKDLSVLRLQDGWKRRLEQEKRKHRSGKQKARVNQKGLVKINGRKSMLETKNLSKKKMGKLMKHARQYDKGKVTVRKLATLLSKELKMPKARHFSQVA